MEQLKDDRLPCEVFADDWFKGHGNYDYNPAEACAGCQNCPGYK